MSVSRTAPIDGELSRDAAVQWIESWDRQQELYGQPVRARRLQDDRL